MLSNGRNLRYCCFYGGELECPASVRVSEFGARIWMAELLACRGYVSNATEFLSKVVASILKSPSRDLRPVAARYIVEYRHCSLNEKMEVARKFLSDEHLTFSRPRGRTVFEACGRMTLRSRLTGVFLFYDGRIYELNGDPKSTARVFYSLRGECRPLAREVVELFNENWDEIQRLPSKVNAVYSGAYCRFKFLSKIFVREILETLKNEKDVVPWCAKVLRLFEKHGINLRTCVTY